jgi:hypothetical protein
MEYLLLTLPLLFGGAVLVDAVASKKRRWGENR